MVLRCVKHTINTRLTRIKIMWFGMFSLNKLTYQFTVHCARVKQENREEQDVNSNNKWQCQVANWSELIAQSHILKHKLWNSLNNITIYIIEYLSWRYINRQKVHNYCILKTNPGNSTRHCHCRTSTQDWLQYKRVYLIQLSNYNAMLKSPTIQYYKNLNKLLCYKLTTKNR